MLVLAAVAAIWGAVALPGGDEEPGRPGPARAAAAEPADDGRMTAAEFDRFEQWNRTFVAEAREYVAEQARCGGAQDLDACEGAAFDGLQAAYGNADDALRELRPAVDITCGKWLGWMVDAFESYAQALVEGHERLQDPAAPATSVAPARTVYDEHYARTVHACEPR